MTSPTDGTVPPNDALATADPWPEYSLASLREVMLAQWNPPASPGAVREWAAIAELWHEVKLVQSVGAWRSSVALCGQILESALRLHMELTFGVAQRYERRRRRRDGQPDLATARKLTFEELIDAAISRNVFETKAALTIVGSLHNARERRNVASHFSPYQRHGPNERRATESIALLICFVDWLLIGDDRVHQAEKGSVTSATRARKTIAEWKRTRSEISPEAWASLFREALADASPRTCDNLVGHAKELPLEAQRECRRELHRALPLLVRRCGPSHIKDVLALVGRLWALGLHAHAQLIASLVPLDSVTLELVARPGQTLRTAINLLSSARRVDAQMFEVMITKGHATAGLATSLQERVAAGAFKSQDLAELLNLLPARVQGHIWNETFTRTVVLALASKPPVAYAHVVGALPRRLREAYPGARAAHRQVCDALIFRCRSGWLNSFRPLLQAVAEATEVDGSLCGQVSSSLVSRLDHPWSCVDDSSMMVNLLWEILAYSPSQQALVLRTASQLACDATRPALTNLHAWTLHALTSDHRVHLRWEPRHAETARRALDEHVTVRGRLSAGYALQAHETLQPDERDILIRDVEAGLNGSLQELELVAGMQAALHV